MKFCYDVLKLFFLLACINQILAAPIDDNKKNERCATAKGSLRSAVEDNTSKNKQVHLLADLDALSHGIKRAAAEDDCSDNADKKTEVKELSAGAVSGEKRNELKESIGGQIVDDEEGSKGSTILETAKAAIRSVISTNTTDASNSTANAQVSSPENNAENNASDVNNLNATAQNAENKTASVKTVTNAKTFIARSESTASNNKRPVAVSRKVNIVKSAVKPLKPKININKSSDPALSHRSLHASIVPDDAPSMERGSLTKTQETHVKASTKSTSSIIGPLNNAIKSLDSATKLLGAAAAGSKTAGLANIAGSNKLNAAPQQEAKAALLPKITNATSVDITSTARSASSSSSGSKAGSSAPAAAPAASTSGASSSSPASSSPPASSSSAASATASKVPSKVAVDPYAEIANGPDSPKTPDLKTGSEKAGLPVMKVDPGSDSPEPVSFDKGPQSGPPEVQGPQETTTVEESAPSTRPGPQDVGGILDKLTDRLNKGGSAIEQPLPESESKTITEQLNRYDDDALQTAKGWESNGLKALEKLKTAEFKHGNMKNELSKELTERLSGGMDMSADADGLAGGAGGTEMGGGGYNAALGAGLGGEDLQNEVPNLQSEASNYSPPQATSQWSQDNANTIESLDSEAQREEQPFSQYAQQDHVGSYAERYAGPASESSISTDSNAYDRQDISSYLNQSPPRDGMDIGSEQGQYFKRSVILRPLYYYYQHLPYAFKHPYDD